jgi:hypothetical protein
MIFSGCMKQFSVLLLIGSGRDLGWILMFILLVFKNSKHRGSGAVWETRQE